LTKKILIGNEERNLEAMIKCNRESGAI